MTPEQQIDVERLDRYIARMGLASAMNNTKWRETIQVLQAVMTEGVCFRIKDVRGAEPPLDYWDRSFPYHVGHFKSVEWMEIQTVAWKINDGEHTGRYMTGQSYDDGERIAEALSAKSIPFYRTEGVIRIQGYTRFSRPA